MSDSVILDPNDPFDAALIPIVLTNRNKRADYARDGDPFSNFTTTSALLGLREFKAVDSAFFNVLQKVVRIQSLRLNGRLNRPNNETVLDTYLDLAVYAAITYAIASQQGKVDGTRLSNSGDIESSPQAMGTVSRKTRSSG